MANAGLRRGRPVPSVWLPVAVSAGIHGLLAGALSLCPGEPGGRGPLPIDTCVFDRDGPFTLSLAEEGPRAAGRKAVPSDDEPSEPFEARILDAPPVAAPLAPVPSPRAAEPGRDAPPDGGPGRGGGPDTPSFFRVAIRAPSVVFVLDRSISMDLSGALDVARDELTSVLERLPQGVRFQVILYNSRAAEVLAVRGGSGLLAADDETVRQAVRAVRAARGAGGTDHVRALKHAMNLRPDVIFLVTDAADLTRQQVRELTERNRGKSVIHAVELGPGAGKDGALEQLARGNGGTHRVIKASGL